jgi:hypothetical protein
MFWLPSRRLRAAVLPNVECYHAAVGAWRRAHPNHTATYAAQQAVRIVLDIKASLRIEEV